MKTNFRRKAIGIGVGVSALLLLLILGIFMSKGYFQKSPLVSTTANHPSSQPREKIRFANVLSFGTSLVAIAQDKKYFEEENIDLEVSLFDVGKLSMDHMFANKSDFAFAAQTPIVAASFDRSDFKIAAAIASSHNLCKIIARKDKGISKAEDLKGKKLNGTKSTALEHFLNIFLDKYAVNKSEVIISTLDLKTAIPMLLKGDIDGLVAQEPIVMDLEEKLGDNAIVLEAPHLYNTHGILLVSDDFIKRSPTGVERFIRALSKAMVYYDKNSPECKEFLAKYHKTDLRHIEVLMQEYDLHPTITQSFLLNIENESRSMISDGLTGNKARPNYLNYLFESPLKKVLPNHVNIIR